MDFTQNENVYNRSRINKRSSERRSSILKIQAGVLSDLDPNSQVPLCEPPVKKSRRCSKRVSFAESCQVKEFIELSPNKSATDQEHVSNEGSRSVTDGSISGLDKLLTGNIQAPSSTTQQSGLIFDNNDTNYECDVFEQTNVCESSQVLPVLSAAEPLPPTKQCSPKNGSDTFLLFLKNLKKRNSDNFEPKSASMKRGVYNVGNENDYSTLMNTNLNKYSISPNKTTHSVSISKQNAVNSDKMTEVLSDRQSITSVAEKENVPCVPRSSNDNDDLMQSEATPDMDFNNFMACLNKNTEPNGNNIFNNEREIFDRTKLFANTDADLDLTNCGESRFVSGPESARDSGGDLTQSGNNNIDTTCHSVRRKSGGVSALFDFDNMDMTDCLGPLMPVNMNESASQIGASNKQVTDISHNITTNSMYSTGTTSSNQIGISSTHDLTSSNQSSLNKTQLFSETANQLEYTECVQFPPSTTEHLADETLKRSRQNVTVICNASLAEMDMTCMDVSRNGADADISVLNQRANTFQNHHVKNGSENIERCVGNNMRDRVTDMNTITCNQVCDSSGNRADGNSTCIPIKVTDDETSVPQKGVQCAESTFSNNNDTHQHGSGQNIYNKTIVFRDENNDLELTECVEYSNTNNAQPKLNIQELSSSKEESAPTNSNFLDFMKNLKRKSTDDPLMSAQDTTMYEHVVSDKTQIFSGADDTVDMTNCIGGIIISDMSNGINQPAVVLTGSDKENMHQSGKENNCNQSISQEENLGHYQTFDSTIDKENVVFKDTGCSNHKSMPNQKKSIPWNPVLDKENCVNLSMYDPQHGYDKTVVFTNVDNDVEITECIEQNNIDQLTNMSMSSNTDQSAIRNVTNLQQENRAIAGSRENIYLKPSATDNNDRLQTIDKTVVFAASDDNGMDMTLCVGGVVSQNNNIVEKLSYKPGILKRRSIAPAEERTVVFAPSDDNAMETTRCIGGILPSCRDNEPETTLNSGSEKLSSRPGILKRQSIVPDKTIMFASSGDDDMDMTSCIGAIVPSQQGELQKPTGPQSSVRSGILKRRSIANDKTVVFSMLDDNGMEMTRCIGGIMTGHGSFTAKEAASGVTICHVQDKMGQNDVSFSAVNTEENSIQAMVGNLQSAHHALAEEDHTRRRDIIKPNETVFDKADVDLTEFATCSDSEKDTKVDKPENTENLTRILLENTTRFDMPMEMTRCHTGVISEGRASTINMSQFDESRAASAKSIYGNSSMDFTCGVNESSSTSQYKRNDRTVHTELTMDFTNCQTTADNRSTNDRDKLAQLDSRSVLPDMSYIAQPEIDHAEKKIDGPQSEQFKLCHNEALSVKQPQIGHNDALHVKKPQGCSEKENFNPDVLPLKPAAFAGSEDYETNFAAFQHEISKTIDCIESHGKDNAANNSVSHYSDSVPAKRHRLTAPSNILEESQLYEAPAVRGQKVKAGVNQIGLEKNVALLKGSQKLTSNLNCLQNVLQHRKKSLSDFSRLSLQNMNFERSMVSVDGQCSDISEVDSSKETDLAESSPDQAPADYLDTSLTLKTVDDNSFERESGSAISNSVLKVTTPNANKTLDPNYKISISHGALSQANSDDAYYLNAHNTHSSQNQSEPQAMLNASQVGRIIEQSYVAKQYRSTILEMETSKPASDCENSTLRSERLCGVDEIPSSSKKIVHSVDNDELRISAMRESADSVERSLLGLRKSIQDKDGSENTQKLLPSCVDVIRDLDIKQRLLAPCSEQEMDSTDRIPILSRSLVRMTEINVTMSNDSPTKRTSLQMENNSQDVSSVYGMNTEDRTDKLLQGMFDVEPSNDTDSPLEKDIVHVADHFTKLSRGSIKEISKPESELEKQTLDTTRDPCTGADQIQKNSHSYGKSSDVTLKIEENNHSLNGLIKDGNVSLLTPQDDGIALAHHNETLPHNETQCDYRTDVQARHETVIIDQQRIDCKDIEPMMIPPVVTSEAADQSDVHHQDEEMLAKDRNVPDQMNVSVQHLSDLLQNETGFMEECPPDFFDDFNKTANKTHDPRDISYAGRLNSTLNRSVPTISLPPHGHLISPSTVDEFLNAFQISAFIGCAGVRRSSFLPPVVPSHALTNRDKLNIEFVQRVEVQVLEQALKLQMETNEKRLKEIQILEDHIAENNPSVFAEVGNASKTAYDDLKVHVKNCLAACRRQSQALFKAERVKQICIETDQLKASQQQLSQMNESISIAVEQIDQVLGRSQTVCGQLDDELKKRETFQNVDEALLERLSVIETDIKLRESEYTSLCVREQETVRKLSEESIKEQRLQAELKLNKRVPSSTDSRYDPEIEDNLCDLKARLASLQRLHNWRLIDVCKKSATFEFFEGLLDLHVIFDTTSEPHGIETLVVRSPINDKATPARQLRQHLFTQCLTEEFLNLHPNKSDLPKLLSALSKSAKLSHDIALEVHNISLDHLLSLAGSQLCIEFRNILKLVKFKLTIIVTASILSNQTPVIGITDLFGHISEEAIAAVIEHVKPGKQYITRVVRSMNEALSEGNTTTSPSSMSPG